MTSDDMNDVWLIEHWDSVLHHKAYVTWRVEGGLVEALEPILSAPMDVTYLTKTDV